VAAQGILDLATATMAGAIKEITKALPADSVVVDEAVMLTSYVASIMDFTMPGSYFCSITCLGWGLPAALGVGLANSRKPVVALVGRIPVPKFRLPAWTGQTSVQAGC
jgi:thiamine pyrophosphate-dependent acetolactate synthase large subunit-like protein